MAAHPVTIDPALVECIWQEIKASRDEAGEYARREKQREERLSGLLRRMREAGMADHLPTIEEVQAAWRGDRL